MKPADDALIGAYLEGDIKAFEALFDRYARRVLGFALSLGGAHEQAEEVSQTTWLKVVEGLPRYRARGRFQAWLFQIAYRVWLDQVRSAWEKRRVSIDCFERDGKEEMPVAFGGTVKAVSPEVTITERERHDILRSALDALPDSMRQVILLRLDGDMTYREIAATMRSPLGTTLWRARQATRRLKDALRDLE